MDALNVLRAILVAAAMIAALMLAGRGMWVPATVLGLGIAAHLALFVAQRRARRLHRDRALRLDAGSPS